MILKKVAFSILLFISLSHYSQLSGNAFLFGQTNHSGIKAKFISTGGTAVTDSAYTTSLGSYSINITGGAYKVEFSKTGYLNFNYNNNATVILTNTVTLSNATLSLGTPVSISGGSVSGSWTSNNTYIITGNITIPFGQTLTIQPGTTIRFDGNYSVTANGSLIANGNEWNPIRFTSNFISPGPGNWREIDVNGNGSVFNYCIFEYCTFGLNISNCSPVVTNNEFRNFNGIAILASGCKSLISKNWIHDYKSDDYAQGITYDYTDSIIVECNKIHDGGGYGIRPYGGGIVRNNIIYNIKSPARGYAMGCGAGTKALIKNNYMHDCNSGFWIYENVTPIPHPYIVNNTIANMLYTGIEMNGFYASADIVNNIFSNCNIGIYQSAPSCTPMCTTTPSVVSNNLMWNNFGGNYQGVQVIGIGVIVSTNAQGNPVDSYFNMSQDPLFIGGNPPYLTSGSPCLNAGNTFYSSNIGFDSTSICDVQVINVKDVETKTTQVKIFPNQSNGSFTIVFNSVVLNGELVLVNALGQIVLSQVLSQGNNSIYAFELPEGLYNYILLSNKQKIGSGKLVIE